MSDKLQQAITSIKTGNKQLGQQLLAQVLQEEPGNELGWLWMSAVVSEDKRLYCIEQVLKINPNNQQAAQALEKLKQLETKPQATSYAMPASPTPNSPSASLPNSTPPSQNIDLTPSVELSPEPVTSASQPATPEFWTNPTQKTIHFMILLENKLMTAKIEPRLGATVLAKILLGNLPTDLMTEKISVAYSKIAKIKDSGNSLRIDFKDENNHDETMTMECKDKEMAHTILDALERKLGTDFERASAPMNRWEVVTGNSILMAIVLAISAFLYYGALDIESGGSSPTGSARTRGIIVLLGWIGPNGVICIGGGLLLLLLIATTSMLISPPIVTTLTRKDSKENINKSETSLQPTNSESFPTQKFDIPTPKTAEITSSQTETKSPSLIGAALSDGLLAGLVGGVIGIPLPILYLLTGRSVYFVFALLISGLISLFTGITAGILFYKRKLRRGSVAVGIGGGFGGAIAGAICGLTFGFSMVNNLSTSDLDLSKATNLSSYPIMICISLSFISSIVGALTAWIPGLFIKPDPNLKSVDWKENKSEVEVAKIEALQSHSKRRMKTRLIIAGILIALILISSLCQLLAR